MRYQNDITDAAETGFLRKRELIRRLRRDCVIKIVILAMLAALAWLIVPVAGGQLVTGGHVFAGGQVFAAENIPVTVDIPLQYIAGSGSELAEAEFLLTAADPASPMPAGSERGKHRVVLRGSAQTSLGTITYEKPGVYDYRVSSSADPAGYLLKVIATSDGEGSVIINKDGESGKTALVFRGADSNVPVAPGHDPIPVDTEPGADDTAADTDAGAKAGPASAEVIGGSGATPRTGDSAPVILWLALSILSGAVFVGLLAAAGVLPRPGRYLQAQRSLRRASLCVIVLLCLSMTAADSFGTSLKVTLHRNGTCADCHVKRGDSKNDWEVISYDDGIGATTFRWVSYTDPATGKKTKADAYCMQPTKNSPGEGTKNAVLLDAAKAGKQQHLARVLYFADGGPGESALKQYLREHRSTYPDFQTAKERFVLMHMLLAYATDPDNAFRITWDSGNPNKAVDGHLTKAFQKKVKNIYQWCQKHAVFLTDPDFSVSPRKGRATFDEAAGRYVSTEFAVTGGDARQYFRYKVPVQAEMIVTHKDEDTVYAAGETAKVYVGDVFWFTFDQDRSAGIVKTTVKGAQTELLPYRIRSSSNQDIGFYAGQASVTTTFSVSLQRLADPGDPAQADDPTDPTDPTEPAQGSDPQDPEGDLLIMRTLEISKTVRAAASALSRQFGFHADFAGLPEGSYLAVLPGSAAAQITSNSSGDITVHVSGSAFFASRGGDLSGIPVTIIRSDGASQTLLTDANGSIAGTLYADWLREVSGDHSFTIEFLKHRFQEEW